MSMRDYAVDDYGLALNETTINDIASQIFGEDYTENTSSYWGYELYEKGICEYISEFTGELQEVDDDGVFHWGGDYETYDRDVIVYIPLKSYPTLFKKAYNNMEEIVEELKSKVGKYLPEDFDYRKNIRHISGTYFG